MEEKKNNLEEQQAQQQDAAPAGNEGKQQGKTFTQEDVNRIVSERLAREREKAPDQLAERERDLTIRESKMKCRELIAENKDTYPSDLLDVLDTSDFDSFKRTADKLVELFKGFTKQSGFISIGAPGSGKEVNDSIANAFKRKG